jgi:Polyketide cyclase / dehydrase and lipid transport
MSILAVVFLVLLVALAAFLLYVATRPDEFRIERSERIHASPQTVFARVNDLRIFNSWNPFAAADPTVKIVYSGQDRGTGAVYEWDSAGKAGKGRMTILESEAPSKVVMRLEFVKPFVATNTVVFSIAGAGSEANITWTMTGYSGFLHKLFGLLFSMDKTVGGEFSKGLANLKALLEQQHQPA